MSIIVRPGHRCTCHPDRYVRFVIPIEINGIGPTISCRSYGEVTRQDIREHAVPPGAQIEIRTPDLSGAPLPRSRQSRSGQDWPDEAGWS